MVTTFISILLASMIGFETQERVATFEPAEGEYELVTGVCLDPKPDRNDTAKPMGNEIKSKLIQSMSYQGNQVKFVLGEQRWSCPVTEVYERVQILKFDELKGRALHQSDIAQFWVLQLKEIESKSCADSIQKSIAKFYKSRVQKEKVYVRFHIYPLDRIHPKNTGFLEPEIERHLTETSDVISDLYLLTLLDEKWFQQEKLNSKEKHGKKASHRLGEGIERCTPVKEFIFSHVRSKPLLKDVPLGRYQRRIPVCLDATPSSKTFDDLRLPFPEEFHFEAPNRMQIVLEKDECRLKMTYEKFWVESERLTNGVQDLSFSAALRNTEVISCPSREIVQRIEEVYRKVGLIFARPTSPSSIWQIGSNLGIKVPDPELQWLVLLMIDGESLSRHLDCERPMGVFYEFIPETKGGKKP
jgi:hypothetical protein